MFEIHPDLDHAPFEQCEDGRSAELPAAEEEARFGENGFACEERRCVFVEAVAGPSVRPVRSMKERNERAGVDQDRPLRH